MVVTPQRWLWRYGQSRWRGETGIRGGLGQGRPGTLPHSRQHTALTCAPQQQGQQNQGKETGRTNQAMVHGVQVIVY